MFKQHNIDFKSSGVLNTLVVEYLSKNPKLRPFYSYSPDKEGFSQLLKTDLFKQLDRKQLSDILHAQSLLVNNGSEASLFNIQKLNRPNTYTVTTGHQLCLFTGPLYFIYKIFSTINLAEKLKREFPDFDFVPVYWMASEDHDFEEVNHFNAFGKTITWKSEQSGAVGDFKTDELQNILPQIQALLGRSENSDFLITLFENAYLKHKTLSDATRFLVNELFGAYGLITLDGNDKLFKEQFKEEFKSDLFSHAAFEEVNQSIKELSDNNYHAQVNPRSINCFFIEAGVRTRIEKQGDTFNLVGTKRNFTKAELESIVENSPHSISPNVVLRPLYQQKILPNIAYVGGPGELAYWLEFKRMFDAHGILFPILMPRNFVTVIDKATSNKIEKLQLTAKDLYTSEQDLIKHIQIKQNAVFDLNKEKENLTAEYTKLLEKVSNIEKTLSGSVSAELKRSLNGLERITGKTNRAVRRKLETESRQIGEVKQRLFPNGAPQERVDNFSSFYLSFGKNFFDTLKKSLDPFEQMQIILTEEK